MKLYTSLTTPFGRRVRIWILEKKLSHIEQIEENIWASGSVAEQLNPLSKVPVLQLDNGNILCDSKAICEYLDHLPSEINPLIPHDFETKVTLRQIEVIADGVCEAAVNIFVEKNKRSADKIDENWIARQQLKITRGIAALDGKLNDFNKNFNFASISVICALGYVDLRLPELAWQSNHIGLKNWYETQKTRPSVIATQAP